MSLDKDLKREIRVETGMSFGRSTPTSAGDAWQQFFLWTVGRLHRRAAGKHRRGEGEVRVLQT